MSVEHPHSKAIAAMAREVLGPLGLKRKGRSRIWLDDQGWWVGVVEFQPSDWSRGTYLNVSAHWLWSDDPTLLSFDYGPWESGGGRIYHVDDDGRRTGYWRSTDGEDFSETARFVAELARDHILDLRSRIQGIVEVEQLLPNLPADLLTRSISLGVAGRYVEAREHASDFVEMVSTDLRELEAERDSMQRPYKWMADMIKERSARLQHARQFQSALDDRSALLAWLTDEIRANREGLKLGPLTQLPVELSMPDSQSDH